MPYKRMDAELLGTITEDTGTEDVDEPDISTWERVKRWVTWFLTYAQHVLNGLKVLLGETILTIPVGGSLSRQLMYFVRLVANSGNWVQHRSVMRYGS